MMRPQSNSGFVGSRPPSSQSVYRPASRISNRGPSRIGHRPPSRGASRHAFQLAALVTSLTGLTAEHDPQEYEDLYDQANVTLETQKYAGETVIMSDIDKKVEG